MSTAKDDILAKIRNAIRDQSAARMSDCQAISRNYIRSGNETPEACLELFARRLKDYDATVFRCAEPDISLIMARALIARGKTRLVVPLGLPQSWLPPDLTFIRDEGLTYKELDRSEGVVTGCAVAIAFTGSIVLRHTPDEGRRALTLIPDYHLCIVFAEQVVDVVSEGISQMSKWGSAPITTIAGPSATADIEMTRVKGVHGPRVLDVILVVDGYGITTL